MPLHCVLVLHYQRSGLSELFRGEVRCEIDAGQRQRTRGFEAKNLCQVGSCTISTAAGHRRIQAQHEDERCIGEKYVRRWGSWIRGRPEGPACNYRAAGTRSLDSNFYNKDISPDANKLSRDKL